MVAVAGEYGVTKNAMKVADGRIMDVGGVEVVVGPGTDVRSAVPQVESLLTKTIRNAKMSTFVRTKSHKPRDVGLRQLVLNAEHAKFCHV